MLNINFDAIRSVVDTICDSLETLKVDRFNQRCLKRVYRLSNGYSLADESEFDLPQMQDVFDLWFPISIVSNESDSRVHYELAGCDQSDWIRATSFAREALLDTVSALEKASECDLDCIIDFDPVAKALKHDIETLSVTLRLMLTTDMLDTYFA